MALKPCLDCGRPSDGPRCRLHRAARERTRPARPTNETRTKAERERRAAAVAAHRAEHGEWCPGWRCAPHPVHPPNILTADHPLAVGNGGAQDGPLEVLCRVCNGGKSDHQEGEGGPARTPAPQGLPRAT